MSTKVRHLHRLAILVVLLAAAGVIAYALLSGHGDEGTRSSAGNVIRASRPLMGTVFKLSAWAPSGHEEATADMLHKALDGLEALERRISSWDDDSETSAVNRAEGKAVAVGNDVLDLTKNSLKWAKRSGGAFDPTGGPLFELWGRARKEGKLPSVEAIEKARKLVGFNNVAIAGETIRLKRPGMKLGFGGLGKGFAADRAAKLLRAGKIESFIIDAGGDLLVEGKRGNRPWNVGVRHPRRRSLLATFGSTNCAIATSGDYEQFVAIDGTRYSHIIDPRSGRPAVGLVSVTVIAERGADADALATAIFVLGADAGLKLVEASPGVEALVVEHDNRVRTSSGLALEQDQLVLSQRWTRAREGAE